jgi:hypothetical protein
MKSVTYGRKKFYNIGTRVHEDEDVPVDLVQVRPGGHRHKHFTRVNYGRRKLR